MRAFARKALSKAGRPFSDPRVKAVFDSYAPEIGPRLLEVRELIFAAASETEAVGELVETLKWGQPAYLPRRPKTGTTIRIDALRGPTRGYAMFFHCQTTLISTFREMYREAFAFEGNRAIVFSPADAIPVEALKHCVSMALTYHLQAGGQRRGPAL